MATKETARTCDQDRSHQTAIMTPRIAKWMTLSRLNGEDMPPSIVAIPVTQPRLLLEFPRMHKVLKAQHGIANLKLRELWEYRELAFFLAWRDVLVRYKQTVIGVFWAVIRPFLTLVIFSIVFGRLAKIPSGGIPYPVFALAGLLPWQLFASAFSEISSSVVSNNQLVSKVYFPRLIIPLSATITSLVDFAISTLMLAALMFWYRIPIGPSVLLLFPLTLLCVLTALGSGIWFAALFVRYRDVRHLVPFAVQLGIYVSPVGFASTIVPQRWRFLYSLNPLVGVIDGFRRALFGRSSTLYLPGIAISIILAIVMLITGMFYFRSTERVFADII
jgi:lipopolysaccharide transport system permease protein